MTDEDILTRLVDGSLEVNQCTGEAVSIRRGRRHTLRVLHRRSNGSSYRFVEICHKGKQKKIAVHRLVWMAANRRVVPDGYDVDHINGKSIEHPDCIDNLRLLDSSRNRSRGYVSPSGELPF